jgi:hypothetical protein
VIHRFSDQEPRGFNFDSDVLPKHCFQVVKHERFYELDEDGWPRIGALVEACSKITDIYSEATMIKSYFSAADRIEGLTLGKLKAQYEYEAVSIGYAILFKYVDQQCDLFAQWRDAFVDIDWSEEADWFTGRRVARSLKEFVMIVARCVESLRHEEFSIEDIQERGTLSSH